VEWPIAEAVCLAGVTGMLCYWNAWLRIDMTEEMERLFKQCEGVEDYNGVCLYVLLLPRARRAANPPSPFPSTRYFVLSVGG